MALYVINLKKKKKFDKFRQHDFFTECQGNAPLCTPTRWGKEGTTGDGRSADLFRANNGRSADVLRANNDWSADAVPNDGNVSEREEEQEWEEQGR